MGAPSISIRRAKGQPTVNPATDFAMAIIGASSTNVPGTGNLSAPYGNAAAAVADLGIGDAVDALAQCLIATSDNPSPPAVAFYSTPATTPGVRGVTLTVSGVVGTSTVSKTASTHPLGTWEPRARVVDDGNNGAGGTVGVAGIILQGSLDGGRTWLPTSALGTATTWKIQIPNPGGAAIDTGVQYDFTHSANTLITGDHWEETKTTPPQWTATSDLYASGASPTGALIVIANNALNFGIIAITEPVAAADIATLSAGLTAMQGIKASCRPTLIVRFRDQAAGESDSTYIAAWQTFRAACADDGRIAVVVGDGWITDLQRSYILSRNGIAAVLARLQGMAAIPGKRGEKVAQDPGWTARGPIPNFTIRTSTGAQVGHDERIRAGILGPLAGKGGGLCFYYEGHESVAGTYVCADAQVLYGVGDAVVTLMDNRVSSGIERTLYAVAFTALGGADIVTSGVMEQSACDAMSASAQAAIVALYPTEFANPLDPNLVRVDPNVVVSGAMVTTTWYVNNRLFDYINGVSITVGNVRN